MPLVRLTVQRARAWAARTIAIAMVSALPGFALAQAPLSAIDWLREDLSRTRPGGYPVTPPTGDAWLEGMITTRRIDALRPESVGLFPAARAGLPADFWGSTPEDELTALIANLPVDTLPALRDLSFRLLLAEFDAPYSPPADRTTDRDADRDASNAAEDQRRAHDFLAARIDKLMDFGAIDQAAALLDTLNPADPDLRMRRFEMALLLEQEQRACQSVLDADAPLPFEPAAVFCLARQGDWSRAAERLEQAMDAGTMPEPYDQLLVDFLDVDDHTHSISLPGDAVTIRPSELSPLAWRLLEATGEPVATHGLPVAFAHADLRGTIGWRAQLEAAERLVRSGALPPNRLLGLYTERGAAASGGIWERVRAIQRLDTALSEGESSEIGRALREAWPQVTADELETAFADLFAPDLMEADLDGEAAEIAITVGLLSDDYEQVALDQPGTDARGRFLSAIARGLPPRETGADDDPIRDSRWAAVAEAFANPAPIPEETRRGLSDDRLGEVILRTLISLESANDPRVLAEGLAVLRHVGLEDIARRAALQSLLLERRG
ncbi:MAG: hypothetical protein HLUCCA12_10240 [Rhodobacteraceae bacterium HLUCCA12]|nr:MAG: hypothetical protein HLUCCA12_10240 [Rhodobacteraceae bacterium HLUCCA12]